MQCLLAWVCADTLFIYVDKDGDGNLTKTELVLSLLLNG
jgi:hypothetical protein